MKKTKLVVMTTLLSLACTIVVVGCAGTNSAVALAVTMKASAEGAYTAAVHAKHNGLMTEEQLIEITKEYDAYKVVHDKYVDSISSSSSEEVAVTSVDLIRLYDVFMAIYVRYKREGD